MGQRLPKTPSTDKVREGVARLINPLAGTASPPTSSGASPAKATGPIMTRRADAPDIHLPRSGVRRANKRISMASSGNRRMSARR